MNKYILSILSAALLVSSMPSNAATPYVRGAAGYVFPEKMDVKAGNLAGTMSNLKANGGFGMEVAYGYKFDVPFRLEGMLGYHNRSVKKSDAKVDGANVTVPVDAKMQKVVGLINLYWDIIECNGFTPFFGGGLGLVSNIHSGSVDGHSLKNDALSFKVSWRLTGGVNYKISDKFSVDLAYAHTDFGKARNDLKNTNNLTTSVRSNNKTLMIGLRYKL